MNPQAILDAAPFIATAGTATALVVQMLVMWAGVETPRAKVATAVITAFVLTLLFAFSNALLTVTNAFGLAIATITVAGFGSGAQHIVTTTAKSSP